MKKILLSALCAVLTLSAVIFSGSRAAAAENSGFIYTIINNEATITGYEGKPEYISIPETVEGCRVTEIRDNAFYECGSLRGIAVPDTVEKIGHHSFYGCYSLESIVIPDSVNSIGMGCFSGCSSLTSAALPEGIAELPESCFRSCTALKMIVIPDSVTAIGDFCFSACTSLSTVSLGASVTSIGDCSFYMCTSLKSLYIPPSVTHMGLCSAGFAPTNDGALPLEDFTLLGHKGSAAEKYADENAVSFEKADDSVHAFAIQQINGKRISIPSIFFIAAFAVPVLALIFIAGKRRRCSK